MVYFKDIHSFATYRMANESDYSIVEGYDETSTMCVEYTSAGQDDVGSWLIWNGRLFLIANVKPADNKSKTTLTLKEPQAVFDRDVYYTTSAYGALNTGAFLAKVINDEFVNQADTFYAVRMEVSNGVTEPHIPPCEDGEVFNLHDYIAMLRESYDIGVDLTFGGNSLLANIRYFVPGMHNVSMSDGHAILKSQEFGGSTVAKVTTIKNGVKANWFIDAEGNVSNSAPVPRLNGTWEIVPVSNNDDPAQKAREAFKGKSGAHRITFKSDRDFAVGDIINLRTNETLVRGRISSKTLESGEGWWLYKSGDLAVTLTEKLNRMDKK